MTELRVIVDVEETTDSEHETAPVTVVMPEETWTTQAVGTISTATMMEQCGGNAATMMDLKSSDMEYRDSLEKNLRRLRKELEAAVKSKKSCWPCKKCLKDNDKQVKFYTGLPLFVS